MDGQTNGGTNLLDATLHHSPSAAVLLVRPDKQLAVKLLVLSEFVRSLLLSSSDCVPQTFHHDVAIVSFVISARTSGSFVLGGSDATTCGIVRC